MLIRLRRDEGGAVVAIVVLSLVALFAMAVLSIDVGAMLAARRGMVNGADSAALAAAQTCIIQDQSPQTVALQYAAKNGDAYGMEDLRLVDPVLCDYALKQVTVSITARQQLFFAPVLGFQDRGDVAAAATAAWRPTGSAAPIPLVIYEGMFQGHNCDVPNAIAKGTVCYLWEDNNLNYEGQGNFGFIDISHVVGKEDSCPGVGQDQIGGWIDGTNTIGTFTLNYPNATWACGLTAEAGNSVAWKALEDLAKEHAVRDFPIVGPSPADGEAAQIPNPGAKYNVIGFAHFEIVDVGQASQLPSDPVTVAIPPGATLPFDLMAGAPAGAVYNNDAKATPGSVGLTVDPNGLVTSWTDNRGQTTPPASITFSYSTLFGSCGGFPPPNASAHCLELKWNGSTLDVDESENGGQDFGVQGIRLIK